MQEYSYVYNGGTLMQMVIETTVDDGAPVTETLSFSYDASGMPMSVVYNGTAYFYTVNLQGDVMAIVDATGNAVVSYAYDAWGNILSVTGTMADTLGESNPLRYRGYVYDPETGLYYISNRYYNSKIGRWINADNILSDIGQELLGYNLFSYCFNNPVNLSDPTGNWPTWATIVVGVVAAAAAVAVSVVTLGAAAPAAACTLTMMAMSAGLSYGVASAVATATVVVTATAATTYAADIAYSSVTGYSPLKESVFQGDAEAYNTGLQIVSVVTGGMLQAASISPGLCFIAGTEVWTSDGLKEIEKIETGDAVWAWDEETGDVALKEVVETYVNQTDELVHVFVDGEEIITTPTHPFYSPAKGWTDACKLRAGDILVLVNGEYVVVEKVQHEILEAPITVYNFQVEDYHTYFVSAAGVLSHNSCNHGNNWRSERRGHWKDTAKTVALNKDYGAYRATATNIARMEKGLAPIGWDGYPVHLHHWAGIANDFYNYSPVSRTLHQLIHSIK